MFFLVFSTFPYNFGLTHAPCKGLSPLPILCLSFKNCGPVNWEITRILVIPKWNSCFGLLNLTRIAQQINTPVSFMLIFIRAGSHKDPKLSTEVELLQILFLCFYFERIICSRRKYFMCLCYA